MSNNLRDKLANYEVQPPEKVWTGIASSLDDQGHLFAKKLYDYEQVPAAGIWERIIAKLDRPANTGSSTVKRLNRRWIYAGAAAIFFALVLVTALRIDKNASEVAIQNVVNNKLPKKDSTAPLPGEKNQTSVMPPGENEPVRQTTASLEKRQNPKNGTGAVEGYRKQPVVQRSRDNHLPADKYMIFIDGDGNTLRLPKKLFESFVCATQDLGCRQRIESLQRKLASSAFTTDFTGILDMLRNLQENQ